MRRTAAWLFALALLGCGEGGGTDAGAPPLDAGADAATPGDAGADAGAHAGADAGTDAGIDAGLDAGTDAGVDAGTDAGTDAGPTRSTLELTCVPAVGGNEANSGMSLSAGFWPGFRFEVPAGADLDATFIGLNARSAGGTIFASVVRLSGPTDVPEMHDLSGSDVLTTTTIPLPGGSASTTEVGAIGVTLSPGWYAAVFGTGAFGATASSATVHSNSGDGGCGSGFGFPFTIRQSDGMFILQAATPHMTVVGTVP